MRTESLRAISMIIGPPSHIRQDWKETYDAVAQIQDFKLDRHMPLISVLIILQKF